MKRCINLSSGVYLFIVVLTGVASSAVSFENVDAQNKHSCRGDEECVLILDCEKYQSATSVRRHKPEPCGFNGKVPKVCCSKRVTFNTTHKPDTTNEPLTELFHVLPSECGDPIRTIFNVPGPTPPPGSGIAAGFGGRPAERGKWPWMVLLGRWSESGRLGDWFCGGTLITDRHLLTAAHCLSQQQMGSVGARLGEHDLTTTQDVVHQERHIVSVRRHRQYRGAQNDIAVVRLDRPVSESQYVRPICLPAAGSEHDGRDVEMAGFGYLEFAGALPDVLQEVPLRVSDVQVCERAYRRLAQFQRRFPGGFQGTKLCALSRDEVPRDACPGDSGGPLMARRPGGLYELVGVVSTGVGCGDPQFPGIYSKVAAYIGWILAHLD